MSSSAALYAAAVLPSSSQATVPPDAEEKAHHVKEGKGAGTFEAPWPSCIAMKPLEVVPTILWRAISRQGNNPDTTPPTVTVRKPVFLPERKTSTLRATWLGHACYLVEFPSGLRVLFDPVFTKRCSPFSWFGPARFTDVPCEIEDMPFIDAVFISHSHYDHLSHPTIMRIKKHSPNVQFFVGLGNKAWFESCGIKDGVTELDWWDTKELRLTPRASDDGSGSKSNADIVATIDCLPSQHQSGRTPFDRNKTLWASWSIDSGGKKIWFAGDTGYRTVPRSSDGEDDYSEKYDHLPRCPAFKQIGEHRGPFDLGLIPIGAYEPRWLFSNVHGNPEDAVNMFLDTKCKKALGMHWGTWVLTEEEVLEPPKELVRALTKKGMPETGVFDICDIGESREIL